MTEQARIPCKLGRRLAWCEYSRACLAVGEALLPGLRCLKPKGHAGAHEGQGRTWGAPVDPDAPPPPRRRSADTAATIAMLLGLALPLDLEGRRR